MWSKYQEAVFDFASNDHGHGTVQAVAGSGKTTTGMEMITRFGEGKGIFSSFTRTIVDELARRIEDKRLTNVSAMTYNTFGYKLFSSNMIIRPKLLTDYNGQKTDLILKYDVLEETNGEDVKFYYDNKPAIVRLVSLLKNLCVLSLDEADARLNEIIDYYDVTVTNNEKFRQVLLDVYRQCLTRTDIIDFDDQKFFPVLFSWKIPQFDYVVIDEYQDTCPLESKLMLKAGEKQGRIIVFGDSAQAIYSFKGTAPDSMEKFTTDYRARSLPLSICYRCPRLVVEEAKKIVPHIEAAPNAIEGVVDNFKNESFYKTVNDADLVLGRTTACLVRSVIKLLRDGRAAYVEGRDYAGQLIGYIAPYRKCNTAKEMFERLESDYHEKHAELLHYKKENAAMALEAKFETISVLILGCQTVNDLEKKIDTIFKDGGKGIRHLTIHKSKGLEGNRHGNVYVLRPDLLPHPRAKTEHHKREEERLKYVAITRTKNGLFYVEKEKDEK